MSVQLFIFTGYKKRACEPLVISHLCSESSNRLAVQLTDPGLSDSENRSNFFEIHVLFVIHAHDVLLTFG
jgi:hypothetical protein